MPYIKQDKPFRVPTTDGKIIEEHFGLASVKTGDLSIAHMVAPSGWSEPHQNPEFDEYTLVSRGKKLIEVEGEKIVLNAGESILVKKGSKVQYSNPFEDVCEYWSVCIPAFSIEKVNRE
ncbi:MAG TPA: cupin domain-containing protein [Hanamia sp.]|jgi:mannose-6-phosphate isomerase-like protein (cupin superfamily)|nr:cupin domain-containing protein [Hanamia sp.]HZI69037.1 cupin domain-containing protein [Hanamia sp.]